MAHHSILMGWPKIIQQLVPPDFVGVIGPNQVEVLIIVQNDDLGLLVEVPLEEIGIAEVIASTTRR